MFARTIATVSLLGFLATAGPTRAEGPPRRVEDVIVVTVDGFRHQEFFGGADETLMDAKAGGVPDIAGLKRQYWRETAEARRETLLPFVWGTIAKQGQVFGDRTRNAPAKLTNGKKFSYPGYNEMFCGFGDDRIISNAKVSNPNRSVLEFLNERPSLKGRVAAYCTWDVFPFIFRSAQNGLHVHAGWVPIRDEPLSERQRLANLLVERLPRYWPDNTFDAVTMEAAREYVLKHKPRVLFIGLGETDEWAHGRRYDLYLRAAHESDRFLDELWHMLQQMPEYAGKTALLLTTDHGRGGTQADWTSHGPGVEGAENLWIAVIGPDTPALGVRSGVETTQSQVAATIAGLLGEDFAAASPRSAPALPDVCQAAKK
ncbi:MAG: AP protein [Isosphaeraceae bacterium]|nr:AP protein [Isosphaeraceae bacterium]